MPRFVAPGRNVQKKNVSVGYQYCAIGQIKMVGGRNRRIMIPVYKKCFSSGLVTDSRQIRSEFAAQ